MSACIKDPYIHPFKIRLQTDYAEILEREAMRLGIPVAILGRTILMKALDDVDNERRRREARERQILSVRSQENKSLHQLNRA